MRLVFPSTSLAPIQPYAIVKKPSIDGITSPQVVSLLTTGVMSRLKSSAPLLGHRVLVGHKRK